MSDSPWDERVPSDFKLKVWILSKLFSSSFPLTCSLNFLALEAYFEIAMNYCSNEGLLFFFRFPFPTFGD